MEPRCICSMLVATLLGSLGRPMGFWGLVIDAESKSPGRLQSSGCGRILNTHLVDKTIEASRHKLQNLNLAH